MPLLVITLGPRPEEVLQLLTANVLRRNGVFCFCIDDRTKNEQPRPTSRSRLSTNPVVCLSALPKRTFFVRQVGMALSL